MNQKQFIRTLEGDTEENVPPNPEEATNFWSNLWGTSVTHNTDAEWLSHVKEELTAIPAQEPISITVDNVIRITADLPHWKAPGHDGIQGFWLKRFTEIRERIAAFLNICVQVGNLRTCLTSRKF